MQQGNDIITRKVLQHYKIIFNDTLYESFETLVTKDDFGVLKYFFVKILILPEGQIGQAKFYISELQSLLQSRMHSNINY